MRRNIEFMGIQRGVLISILFGLSVAACSPATTPDPATGVSEVAAAEPQEAGESPGVVGEAIFVLDPELSEARFIIGEILANQPNTVIGVNNQIQGGGVLNFAEPALSRLDEFLIDSSGFVTDSNMRNRAIGRFVLQSAQYPVISFQPTDIEGIPPEIVVAETVCFEIVGMLTIRDITREVTFAGEATLVAEDRVEGLATATLVRSDFELSIPSVPRVAGVDEEFILEIEFVAVAG